MKSFLLGYYRRVCRRRRLRRWAPYLHRLLKLRRLQRRQCFRWYHPIRLLTRRNWPAFPALRRHPVTRHPFTLTSAERFTLHRWRRWRRDSASRDWLKCSTEAYPSFWTVWNSITLSTETAKCFGMFSISSATEDYSYRTILQMLNFYWKRPNITTLSVMFLNF